MSINIALKLQRKQELKAQILVLAQQINGIRDLILSKQRSLEMDQGSLVDLRNKLDSCTSELKELDAE